MLKNILTREWRIINILPQFELYFVCTSKEITMSVGILFGIFQIFFLRSTSGSKKVVEYQNKFNCAKSLMRVTSVFSQNRSVYKVQKNHASLLKGRWDESLS